MLIQSFTLLFWFLDLDEGPFVKHEALFIRHIVFLANLVQNIVRVDELAQICNCAHREFVLEGHAYIVTLN